MAAFVQSYGLQVVDRSGKPFDIRQLTSSDIIAFYFSAHWCPPCRQFTPMLKKFVETLTSHGETSLKIIFVSSDKTEHDMWKYMYDEHGEWLALDFSCRQGKERLDRQYQVSGIPQLVVIDAVGRQAVRDARGEVMASVNASSTQILTTYMGWKSAAAATPTGVVPPTAMPPRPAFNELPVGARIGVRGLIGAPEHNGTEGRIRSYDNAKQRYVVELGEKSIALRAANLLQLLSVRLRRGEKLDEWLDAEIVDFDEASDEFVLRCDGDTDPVRAKLGDHEGLVLVLKPGARVVARDLQAESAKQWNGVMGEVLEYDETASRYLVQVSASAQLKLRPENVRFFPLA